MQGTLASAIDERFEVERMSLMPSENFKELANEEQFPSLDPDPSGSAKINYSINGSKSAISNHVDSNLSTLSLASALKSSTTSKKSIASRRNPQNLITKNYYDYFTNDAPRKNRNFSKIVNPEKKDWGNESKYASESNEKQIAGDLKYAQQLNWSINSNNTKTYIREAKNQSAPSRPPLSYELSVDVVRKKAVFSQLKQEYLQQHDPEMPPGLDGMFQK